MRLGPGDHGSSTVPPIGGIATRTRPSAREVASFAVDAMAALQLSAPE